MLAASVRGAFRYIIHSLQYNSNNNNIVFGGKKITQVTHARVKRSHSDRRAVRIRTDRRRRSAESGCRRDEAVWFRERSPPPVTGSARYPRRSLRDGRRGVYATSAAVGPVRRTTRRPSGDGPGSADRTVRPGGGINTVATATACIISERSAPARPVSVAPRQHGRVRGGAAVATAAVRERHYWLSFRRRPSPRSLLSSSSTSPPPSLPHTRPPPRAPT